LFTEINLFCWRSKTTSYVDIATIMHKKVNTVTLDIVEKKNNYFNNYYFAWRCFFSFSVSFENL